MGIRPATVGGGFRGFELPTLPGGSNLGDRTEEVAAALEPPVRYDETFDINRVGEWGYEIISDALAGAPVWGAFVPFVPACE